MANNIPFLIRFDDDTKNKLRFLAEKENRSMSNWVKTHTNFIDKINSEYDKLEAEKTASRVQAI